MDLQEGWSTDIRYAHITVGRASKFSLVSSQENTNIVHTKISDSLHSNGQQAVDSKKVHSSRKQEST